MSRFTKPHFLRCLMLVGLTLARLNSGNAAEISSDSFIYEISRFWGSGLVGDTGALIIGIAPGEKLSGDIILPDSIMHQGKNIPVVGLGEFSWPTPGQEPAICNNDEITSIHFPVPARYVNNSEFIGCHNIQYFSVDPDNEYLGAENGILYKKHYTPGDDEPSWELFRIPSARKEATLVIPSRASSIAPGAFASNNHVRVIVLSGDQMLKGMWQFGNSTIENVNCTSSTRYKSPEEGVLLHGNIFKAVCPALQRTSYTIPEGIMIMEEGAFCESLIREVTIPSTISNPLSNYVFMNSDIEKLNFTGDLPNRVGEACFYNAASLPEISLAANKEGRIAFATSSFFGCKNLNKIILDGDVKTVDIESHAFQDCSSLSEFPLTSKMTIPELNSYAFAGCTSLKAFSLSCVKEIENTPGHQFEGCGLTYVNWPSAFAEVPYGCFKDCKDLTKINLKMTTTDLNPEAFAGSGLTAISFMGVEWYDSTVFSDCPNLSRVYFPVNERPYVSYKSIDFQQPVNEVIVNNPLIRHIDYQETCDGSEVRLYMSAFTPNQNLGNNWSCVYGPGKASEIYASLTHSEVREMFSYATNKNESKVRIGSPAAGVRILGVNIEGTEAELKDGWWQAECEPTEGSKMNVTVNYTVYGNPMQTVYEYPFEVTEAGVMEIGTDNSVKIERIGKDKIELTSPVRWQVFDLCGHLMASGKSCTVETVFMSAGTYILHFPDSPSSSIKFNR